MDHGVVLPGQHDQDVGFPRHEVGYEAGQVNDRRKGGGDHPGAVVFGGYEVALEQGDGGQTAAELGGVLPETYRSASIRGDHVGIVGIGGGGSYRGAARSRLGYPVAKGAAGIRGRQGARNRGGEGRPGQVEQVELGVAAPHGSEPQGTFRSDDGGDGAAGLRPCGSRSQRQEQDRPEQAKEITSIHGQSLPLTMDHVRRSGQAGSCPVRKLVASYYYGTRRSHVCLYIC